jgi:hypothetical protein
MQHEFIFRGSFVQYWKVIFAQWKRTSASIAEPPFEISAPSLSLPPFAEYVPKENETLVIAFYDEKHWEIVAVFADAVIGKNIVKLTVFYNDEAFEKRGESAYAKWLEIQNAWLEKGWLINPAAYIAEIGQLEIRPEQLPKPKTGADLTVFFNRHHQKKKTGQKSTLKQIAEETQFTYGYVRQLYSKYLKERGLAKPEKRTNKKTNKN